MNKLPVEVIDEIVSNLDSCKNILNFCIINSKNKELCKNDSLYLIKRAIGKKYPTFQINNFIKQISDDIDKLDKKSSPFSYLDGKGVYQEDFDAMTDTKIAKRNYYTWKDVRNSLLYLSESIKTDKSLSDIDVDEFLPLVDSINSGVELPDTLQESLDIMKKIIVKRVNDIKNLGNFDRFIDLFIIFNKFKWTTNDYNKYNYKDIKFLPPVYFKKDTDKHKYILTILCKILNPKSETIYLNTAINAEFY